MYKNSTTVSKHDYLFLNQKTIKTIYLLLGVGIIGVVCSIFLILANSNYWFLMAGFITLLFCGIVCIILLINGGKKTIGLKIDYNFNENGFTVTTEQGSSCLDYSAITEIKQNSSTLLLYLSKTQAYIVDKTELEQECIDFISQKLQNL